VRPAANERAFLALVDRHHASLTRVARLWFADPQEIEALVQQTWIQMLQRLEPFDQQSSLKGWLCVTLIRLARTRVDPTQDEPVEPSATELAMPAVDPERFSPHGDRWEGHWQKPPTDWTILDRGNTLPVALQRLLESAIRALPRAQRIIVVLRDVERLTSHEVQSALGSSDEDQRILLHHARSRLRAVLELEPHHLTHAAQPPTGEVEHAP
jgi:RNA polymerase sigma-70 factor (ECF subfamily)